MIGNGTNSGRLNLGCGPNAPAGWLNVDGSWKAWLSNHSHLLTVLESIGLTKGDQGAEWKARPVVHDLRKPLPFKENTFSAIYASHVLEHLYLSDAQRLLSECKRVLMPGAAIRLVVPDLHSIVVDYLNRKNANEITFLEKASAADRLNEKLRFRSTSAPSGNFVLRYYTLCKDFHSHKWMYDSDSLVHYLEMAGFQDVSEKEFLISNIPGIEEVEKEDRVMGGEGICIEAKKP